jgi:hypothetical protein
LATLTFCCLMAWYIPAYEPLCLGFIGFVFLLFLGILTIAIFTSPLGQVIIERGRNDLVGGVKLFFGIATSSIIILGIISVLMVAMIMYASNDVPIAKESCHLCWQQVLKLRGITLKDVQEWASEVQDADRQQLAAEDEMSTGPSLMAPLQWNSYPPTEILTP